MLSNSEQLATLATAGYKDIAVHLDGTPEDETRLAHVEFLAALFGAHLTGVYTNRLPDMIDYSVPTNLITYVELENQLRADGEVVRKKLAERFKRLAVPNELRKIEAMTGDLGRAVAMEARWGDLFVTSCLYDAGAGKWSSLIEDVLFEGGHGVLLVPKKIKPREAIRTVVIGWVNAREAARAVTEALPLLRLATATHLVCVEEDAARVGPAMALSDIAAHLDRHGVTVNVKMISDAPRGAAEAILGEARRVSADLIVAGAYAHSRLREWILGGATRELIGRSNIPLLMAH